MSKSQYRNVEKWDSESINKIINNELVIGSKGDVDQEQISTPISKGKEVTVLGEESIKSAISLQDIERK